MLQLVKAELVASNILRVTYNEMPLMTPSDAHTARNRFSYVVTNGYQDVAVDSVKPTSADPYSVDLKLDSIPAAGDWTLRITNVQTVDEVGFEDGANQITFTSIGGIGSPNPGAMAETAEDRVRKFLNPALVGEEWDAYCAAVGYSDRITEDIAATALDQNFFLRAGGIYLERLTAGIGVERPANTGMSDATLGQLASDINANKITSVAMLQVLRAYYGQDAIRTHLDTTMVEPYALTGGQYLLLKLDGTTVRIDFEADDFSNITQATAEEIAAVINRKLIAFGIQGLATSSRIIGTSDIVLRIYSGRLGQSGSVSAVGGSALVHLNFPEKVGTTIVSGTTWDLDTGSAPNRARLTWVAGADPVIASVEVDDILTLYGTPFTLDNRGTFTITAASSTWVEFEKPAQFTQQLGVVLVSANDIVFWRPTVARLQGYFPNVVDDGEGGVHVVLPATAAAIQRTVDTAWYLHGSDFQPFVSATRNASGVVTIETVLPHGLAVGNRVNLQDWMAAPSPTLTSANGSMAGSNTRFNTTGIKLLDGTVFCITSDGSGVQQAQIFDPTTNTWTLVTAPPTNGYVDASGVDKLALLPNGRVLAVSDVAPAGLYAIYDPDADSWATSTSVTLATAGSTRWSLGALSDGRILAMDTEGRAAVYNSVTAAWSIISIAVISSPSSSDKYSSMYVDDSDRGYILSCDTGANSNLIVCDVTALTVTQIPSSWVGSGSEGDVVPTSSLTFAPIGPSGTLFYQTYDGGPEYTRIVAFDIASETAREAVTYQAPYPDLNPYYPYDGTVVQMQDGRYFIVGGTTSSTPQVATGDADRFATIIDLVRGRTNLLNTIAAVSLNFEPSPFQTAPLDYVSTLPIAIRLDDDSIIVFGGQEAGLNWNKWVRYYFDQDVSSGFVPSEALVVEIISPTEFKIQTTGGISVWSTGFWAPTTSPYTYRSGFIIDTEGGVTILPPVTTTTVLVPRGPSGTLLPVADASQFPDEPGYIVFNFGFANQVGPIRYLGTNGLGSLRLEPGQSIGSPQLVGSTVTLLRDRGVFNPDPSRPYNVTWLTASSAGRVEAQADINFIAAGGGGVDFEVLYPGDRGLGNAGYPDSGTQKISDRVWIWGGDSIDAELAAAREEDE